MSDKHQKILLVFIINGQDFSIEANINAPLMAAVQKALSESGNIGQRTPDEWEARDTKGILLEKNRTLTQLGLHNGDRLFLSLRVGAGGIDQSGP